MIFRDAGDADLESIAELADTNDLLIPPLSRAAFVRMLSWLHASPPVGNRLQFVAEDQGRVVAHYGAIPFRYRVNGQEITAGFAANIVIDKDARKKALFFPLQKQFAKRYQEQGYAFAYGVMTRAGVLKPHLAVGWREIGDINVYVKPISITNIFIKLFPTFKYRTAIKVALNPCQWLFNRLTNNGRHSGVVVNQIEQFDASHSQFLAQWMQSKKIAAVRSVETLNWRFAKYTGRGYTIAIAKKAGDISGYVVTRKMPMREFSCLAIVDIVAMDGDATTTSALLAFCNRAARAEKVDLISTVFPAHYHFKGLLMRRGFISSNQKFTLVVHSPKGCELAPKRQMFGDWFISWFDHDFV